MKAWKTYRLFTNTIQRLYLKVIKHRIDSKYIPIGDWWRYTNKNIVFRNLKQKLKLYLKKK